MKLTAQQKYDRSEKGLERHRRYYQNNKKKFFAEQMGRYYNPKTKSCSIKGCNIKGERHHEDYNKAREIIWLCRQHHLAIHNRQKKQCKICKKPMHAKQLCNKHYSLWLKNRNKL